MILLACSVCTTILADWLFPPFHLWFFLALFCFISTAYIARYTGGNTKYVPSVKHAWLIAACAVFIDAGIFLPFLTMALFVPSATGAIELLVRKSDQINGIYAVIRRIYVFTIIVTVGVAAIKTIDAREHRSSLDFLRKWPDKRQAAKIVLDSEFRNSSPDLLVFREIIENYPSLGHIAAKGLLDSQEPETDVPILIELLGEVEIARKDKKGDVEEVLVQLSGLSLSGTDAEGWRKAWDEKTGID